MVGDTRAVGQPAPPPRRGPRVGTGPRRGHPPRCRRPMAARAYGQCTITDQPNGCGTEPPALDGDRERGDGDDDDQDGSQDAGAEGQAPRAGGASVGGRAGRAWQGGSKRGAAQRPCRVRALAGPGRSGRVARAPGEDARAGAGADPLRADAGLAVHLLSRRGDDHGPRSRRDAAVGALRAVLRRCAPVELRRLRLAGTTAGVRHQRLRRDAPGAVGVGRQATGREHADRGARQRVPPQGPGARSCSTRSAGTARRWRASPG